MRCGTTRREIASMGYKATCRWSEWAASAMAGGRSALLGVHCRVRTRLIGRLIVRGAKGNIRADSAYD